MRDIGYVTLQTLSAGPMRRTQVNTLSGTPDASLINVSAMYASYGFTESQRPKGRRGVMFWPFMKGAVGNTITIDVEGVWQHKNFPGTTTGNPQSLHSELLMSCLCLAGARVGVAGGVVLNDERFAKTITVTPTNLLLQLQTMGKPHAVVDGAGVDAFGFVVIPDLYNMEGVRLRVHNFVGATEGNALVDLWT